MYSSTMIYQRSSTNTTLLRNVNVLSDLANKYQY